MNNPFKQSYDLAIELGKNEYDARDCAKARYADYVIGLNYAGLEPEFVLVKLREYSHQLAEVIKY
jgi:hypothetical protein